MANEPDFKKLIAAHAPLCRRLGVNEEARAKLAEYLRRLWRENQHINLFSRKLTPESLTDDHLFDCLAAAPELPQAGKIADLGSGGGMPAIPIAICRPETALVLYEKSPLKRRFLQKLLDLCANVEIRGLLEQDGLDPDVDLIVARAFKPLPALLSLTRKYCRDGGSYILYKGRLVTIEREIAEARIDSDRLRVVALSTLGAALERHLILINPRR